MRIYFLKISIDALQPMSAQRRMSSFCRAANQSASFEFRKNISKRVKEKVSREARADGRPKTRGESGPNLLRGIRTPPRTGTQIRGRKG